jgi:putative endonuclease
MTANLAPRLHQHPNKLVEGFTKRYNITQLVCVEQTSQVIDASAREKQIKGWRRSKKIALVESVNPQWLDWSKEFGGVYGD